MRIAIDPGHGMNNRRQGVYDPGAEATVGKLTEADVVLAVGLTLAWLAKRNLHEVWMSRDDDGDPDPVSTRASRADAWGADVFLSLHCNSADVAGASGVETFFRDEGDKRFAACIQSAAVEFLGSKDRGVKCECASQHQRLAVFAASCPAALLEIEFISSPIGLSKLTLLHSDRDYRIKFCTAILAAIEKWWHSEGNLQ